MKVLLHADIAPLGYLGDVVEVANGYARNYLLPQGLAVAPTEANIKAIAEKKARQAERRRLARKEMQQAAERVNEAEVVIVARANEQGHLFGSVGEAEIAAALQQMGHAVQAKHVALPEHFRQLGEYDVKLRFAPDVQAGIRVQVVRPEEQGDAPESTTESEREPESRAGAIGDADGAS